MSNSSISRRAALKTIALAATSPLVRPLRAQAPPSETLLHASFGASGMAFADLRSIAESKNVRLVAVADVDLRNVAEVKKLYPNVRVYQDWRELLDKEKRLDSANVSTPDHMHGSITVQCLNRGLNVYTQKPLTQTIFEARRVREIASEKKAVTQMGIQIHSHEIHKKAVATIRSGAIGKVSEVHSWSGKHWGDKNPRPNRSDPIPRELAWDLWLGVAGERPYVAGYYHPSEWRKRLDFGTGTFGDMGCHILDPVFGSLSLTAPRSVRSEGGAPGSDSWGLDSRVRYVFPGTERTTDPFSLYWYDGDARPPEEIKKRIGDRPWNDQGSVYIGEEGVLYSPYIAPPVLFPVEKFKEYRFPEPEGNNHYLQFVEACRGDGKTSTPFDYSGPLTEAVLLGCLSTRFPRATLDWDAEALKVTNHEPANAFVRRECRQGWDFFA